MCFFGKRSCIEPRHIGALNKYDSEWTDGIVSGVSGLGVSVLVGTLGGILKAIDYRRSPDGRWNKDLVLGVVIILEEYICPTATPAPFVIEAGERVPGIAPEVAEEVVNARKVRLVPRDFCCMGTPEVARAVNTLPLASEARRTTVLNAD